MEISFVRSGGFVGPATQVEGKAVITESGGSVVSEKTGYRRDLTAEEATKLMDWATAAVSKGPDGTGPGQIRDAYSYRVQVLTGDGKNTELELHERSLQPFADWIRTECERIWTERVRH